MSSLSSYPTKAFKESQKFVVRDPATGSVSFVLGSDLVSYISPKLNYVRSETTRLAAENEDYKVGNVVQTTGATSVGDGQAALYLVVAAGEGDFPMLNGNELLVIAGDEFLREQLASNATGDGTDLIAYTGTSDTVTETFKKRVTSLSDITSLSDLNTAALVDGQQISVAGFYSQSEVGGGTFAWRPGADKSTHNVITVIDPDRVSAWDGTLGGIATLQQVGSGSGCWVRVFDPGSPGEISIYCAGAQDSQPIDNIIDHFITSTSALELAAVLDGEFSCSKEVVINTNAVIRGKGVGVIDCSGNASDFVDFIDFRTCTKGEVSGLHIKNLTGKASYGVRATGPVSNVVMSDNTVEDCSGGLVAGYSVDGGVLVPSTGISIIHNSIINTVEENGIMVMQSEDCAVIGNVINGVGEHGIRVVGANRCIVDSNRVLGPFGLDGINCQRFTGEVVTPCTDVTISNNIVFAPGAASAISIYNAAMGVTICGNVLVRDSSNTADVVYGVRISDPNPCKNIVIANNEFKDFTRCVFVESGDHTNISVLGNTFLQEVALSSGPIYVISIAGGSIKGLYIDNNSFNYPFTDEGVLSIRGDQLTTDDVIIATGNKFRIGNPNFGNYIAWTGTGEIIKGPTLPDASELDTNYYITV